MYLLNFFFLIVISVFTDDPNITKVRLKLKLKSYIVIYCNSSKIKNN